MRMYFIRTGLCLLIVKNINKYNYSYENRLSLLCKVVIV